MITLISSGTSRPEGTISSGAMGGFLGTAALQHGARSIPDRSRAGTRIRFPAPSGRGSEPDRGCRPGRVFGLEELHRPEPQRPRHQQVRELLLAVVELAHGAVVEAP